MTSNITVVDIEEDKQQENEAVETIQEETTNEAVVEPVEQQSDEIVSAPPETKPEPKKKQPPIPLDQTVKQNAKQQDKLVKCPQCDKQMKLKSYRYKHEATCRGKLEDIPKKPKAMPKPKTQPIQQPIQVIEPKPTPASSKSNRSTKKSISRYNQSLSTTTTAIYSTEKGKV